MARPRVYKTEAIILKQTPLGEADKILTLYTPYLGKIRVVAKGVRKSKSRISGHVEPLTRSAMMLAQGRNLDVVSQSQTLESFISIREDLERMSCALYIADLLDLFTFENEESYPLYALFLETLRWLTETPQRELALRYFEIHLFELLGYRPQLHRCVLCASALDPAANYFSASGGGTLCPRCQHRHPGTRIISLDALKVMRFLQRESRASVVGLIVSPEVLKEIEGLLRVYIQYLLEREVKSASFMDRLRLEKKGVALASPLIPNKGPL